MDGPERGADPCRSDGAGQSVKERWRKKENRDGERDFILAQSGGGAQAGRLARMGGAKPEAGHAKLEAGKGAPFTRTYIIK